MEVAFVSGTTEAAGTAILGKVVRYFCGAAVFARLCAILALSKNGRPVCSVIEYYVCQYCARNSVLVKGYPVFAQYKIMISVYTKQHFSASWDEGGQAPLPLKGAHFLHWFIMHDLDLEFVQNFELFATAMRAHRRQMARTYRKRQQAKQKQESKTPPPLGMTAAKADRLRPPIVRTSAIKRRRSGYASAAQAAEEAGSAAGSAATGFWGATGNSTGGGGIFGGGGFVCKAAPQV